MRAAWLVLPIGLALVGCSRGGEAAQGVDNSKLSADLEQRARAIEERANSAAAEVEKDSATELRQLNEEAATAPASASAATPTAAPNQAADAPSRTRPSGAR